MTTEPLTKEEKAWLKKLEKVLMNPPTKRIGFYTIGDPVLHVYDKSRLSEIDDIQDSGKATDFCVAVEKLDASLGIVESFCSIESTSG